MLRYPIPMLRPYCRKTRCWKQEENVLAMKLCCIVIRIFPVVKERADLADVLV